MWGNASSSAWIFISRTMLDMAELWTPDEYYICNISNRVDLWLLSVIAQALSNCWWFREERLQEHQRPLLVLPLPSPSDECSLYESNRPFFSFPLMVVLGNTWRCWPMPWYLVIRHVSLLFLQLCVTSNCTSIWSGSYASEDRLGLWEYFGQCDWAYQGWIRGNEVTSKAHR